MTRVAVIGFGEVGRCFTRALRDAGVTPVVHVARLHPARRDEAASLGVALRTDLPAGLDACDLVLSVVPGHAAAEVSRAVLPVLPPGAIYADLAAAGAAEKRSLARDGYVDGAIMGAVSLHGAATPVLAAGERAERLAALLNPLGFAVTAMRGGRAGDATSLKLLRSLFTKGLDALIAECMLLAEQQGLREALVESFADLDAAPIRELVAMFLRTHPVHARRRLHEMQSVRDDVAGAGLPSIMLPAILARLERTVALSGRSPYGAPPADPDGRAGLAWLLAAERLAATSPSAGS